MSCDVNRKRSTPQPMCRAELRGRVVVSHGKTRHFALLGCPGMMIIISGDGNVTMHVTR